MIYVIILLAFALDFFLHTPSSFLSPHSPHCVYLCNCVLHKGIRSVLMRNCNCFFLPAFMDMFTRVDETQTGNMSSMRAACLMQYKKCFFNFFFTFFFPEEGICMKAYEAFHNFEPAADTEQWKQRRLRFRFYLTGTYNIFLNVLDSNGLYLDMWAICLQ